MSEQDRFPAVTVVMAVYNGATHLSQALKTLSAQTYQDWELVVVDDGSIDNSADIAAEFPDVRLIKQNNNGSAHARNVGIRNARGSLIAFLDQDDAWCSTKLEKQIELLEKDDEAGLCYTNFDIINDAGESSGSYTWCRQVEDYYDLLKANGITFSSVVVRRKCFDEVGIFDTSLSNIEDYDMWLRISRQYKLAFVPSIETHYRVHAAATSADDAMMYAREIQLLTKIVEAARQSGDEKSLKIASLRLIEERNKRVIVLLSRAYHSLHTGSLRKAVADVCYAWKVSPQRIFCELWLFVRRRFQSVLQII